MDCLFCKIISKELDSKVLYEDELVMVILDAFPNVDGHCLIIPKVHYENFLEIPDSLLLHINNIAKTYTPLLMKKLNCDALTILVNYGDSQKIKHYHLHLLPNYGKCLEPAKKVEDVFESLRG
ncbi:MAG: HIT domain-containing protein [Bacilli bacterium]